MTPPSSPEPLVQSPTPPSRPTLSRSAVVEQLTREFMTSSIRPDGELLGEQRARAAANVLVSCLKKSHLDLGSLEPTPSILLARSGMLILLLLEDLSFAETGAFIDTVSLNAHLTRELQNPKPSYLRTALMGLPSLAALDLKPSGGEFDLRHFPTVQNVAFGMRNVDGALQVNLLADTDVGLWSPKPESEFRVDYFDRDDVWTCVESRVLESPDENQSANDLLASAHSETATSPRLQASPAAAAGAVPQSIFSFMRGLNAAATALGPRTQQSVSDKPHELLAEILSL